MNIEQIAYEEASGEMLDYFSKEQLAGYIERCLSKLAEQAGDEPVVIEEPDYHYAAMGCGLEDRNITDRYEAMEHGWNCAIERMFEQIPDEPLYTEAQLIAAQQKAAEACAKVCDNREAIEKQKAVALREQKDIARAQMYEQNSGQAMLMAQDLRNGEWRNTCERYC